MTTVMRQVLELCQKAGIEKFPWDMYELLTCGRLDQSGAFIEGCGLTDMQALIMIGFVSTRRDPVLAALCCKVANKLHAGVA